MKKCVAFLATTIATKFHVPPSQHQWRFYCHPPSPSSPPPPSSNKLFVGGLSWSVDEKSLKDAFSSFGDVTEVRIVYDKDSGRSRGFGFVIFSNDDDATCAKDAMDGKALLGRPLRISFAFEKARGVPLVVPRFSDIGHLNRKIDYNHIGWRFVTVTFSNGDDAKYAIDTMDGKELFGRKVSICYAG